MLSKPRSVFVLAFKMHAKADQSWEATRSMWLSLADSYRTLLEHEDRYPNPPRDNASQDPMEYEISP